MKKSFYLFLVLIMVGLPFTSCKDDNTTESEPIVFETDFSKVALTNALTGGAVEVPSSDGWSAVFAEYPDGSEEFYELNAGLKNLPEPLDQTKKAFLLSGNNHSDALQMFLVKELTGLTPQSKYQVETEVELASKYPDGSVGIGGSPGNSVHLVSKFATLGYTVEKGKSESDNVQLVLKKEENVPESVMNLDLGDVSVPSDQYIYQLISRKKGSSPDVVLSGKDGKLWVIVGTWSGFEGTSSLYYTKIKITLTPKS